MDLNQRIESYRDAIQTRNTSGFANGNEVLASDWFDSITAYIDKLLEIQQMLGGAARDVIIMSNNTILTRQIVSCVLLVFVIAMCPVVVKSVVKLTSDIQHYAITLADKTKELKREKKRTDSLLYQMLPKPVADQLKHKSDVNAEYFKEVTVFFSDVVAFTRISMGCSPMEVVALLNALYQVFDERIGLYNVYKVETIGESYMVASGKRRSPS